MLQRAAKFEQVIPVYIFDDREFPETSFGFTKTGSHRTQFLLETVQNLYQNLGAIGSDLILRQGQLQEILNKLVSHHQVDTIFASKEVTSGEVATEKGFRENTNANLDLVWKRTLFHRDDILYEPSSIPKVFTNFRKQCEEKSKVQECVAAPQSLPLPEINEVGKIW